MKSRLCLSALAVLGTLSLGAVAADTSSSPSSTRQGATSSMFDQLDANRDGFVSKDEAKRSADISARFKDLDSNSDGKLSTAEYGKDTGGMAGPAGATRDIDSSSSPSSPSSSGSPSGSSNVPGSSPTPQTPSGSGSRY